MRLMIYPADIARITGKSSNTCRTIYKNILKHYDKTKEQGLTIEEYCAFTKLNKDAVQDAISRLTNKKRYI